MIQKTQIRLGWRSGCWHWLVLIAAMLPCWTEAVEYVTRPQDVCPLMIGSQVPGNVTLTTELGKTTTLPEAMDGRPAVLVFFRGGWCPYCDLQLSELRLIEAELKSIDYQVIAISPDKPAAMKARKQKGALGYTLLSDESAELIRAFGIAYQVDLRGSTITNVKAGTTLRLLPVTSIYIVDAKGKVQFQYVNPDYRVRVPKELVLAAAKAARQISM